MPTYKLPEIMDMGALEKIYHQLSDALKSDSSELHLDASEVMQATTPAVQLLASLAKEAVDMDKDVMIISPSAALRGAVVDLAMADFVPMASGG